MRSKLVLISTTAVILLSFLLAGCMGGGGIPPEQYEKVSAQLKELQEETQAQLSQLQNEIKGIQAERDAAAAELKAAQAKVAELQGQVGGLQEQYELVGATPAETAEKIVRYYHETHVYSTYDLFVCSDMSSEVWNMLKAKGINAQIVVGNKDKPVTDILESNHAWVHAEVAPGEYLALETTGGYVVPETENSLYYRGWSFDSPATLKKNNQLVREYNIRVTIRNQMAAEANKVREEHNQATNQTTADKLKAVHDKLTELLEAQEAGLNNIKAEINSLATKCGT